MGMSTRGGFALIASMVASMALAAPVGPEMRATLEAASPTASRPAKRRVQRYTAASSPRYRSKAKAARRVLKPNRLHVSRRVRRKHRRSKAA